MRCMYTAVPCILQSMRSESRRNLSGGTGRIESTRKNSLFRKNNEMFSAACNAAFLECIVAGEEM